MEPRIQYATTKDGAQVAYTELGDGPALITTPGSWESLNFNLSPDVAGAFYAALASRYKTVRYDRRGTGLSTRSRTDPSLEQDVLDIEAVANSLATGKVAIMAFFHLGPAAITYAVRHPDRVSHLLLYGTFSRGDDLAQERVRASLLSMVRSHWGIASRTLADMTAPEVPGEMLERIARDERDSASGEMVAGLIELSYRTDVSDLLASVTVPTLVIHRRGDRVVPPRKARELASGIASCRLVMLKGANHWPWFGDSDSVLHAIIEFLGGASYVPTGTRSSETGAGFHTILFTDVEASTALTQRLGDEKAREVLRQHERIVRDALRSHGGAEVKTMGDGFMASFSSATRALECAIGLQRALAAQNESAEEPIRVRIGLNAGEPIAEEEDLFGTSVDLARRSCDHAEPGQILASNVVRELSEGKGFFFADTGEVALKGFENPVRLYEVRWRQEG